MVKKVIKVTIDTVCIILIILSVIALLTVLFTRNGQAPRMLGYSAFRVLTGSMEPEYPVDCMVIVKEVNPSEIKEGDVISFYSQAEEIQGRINTHRVIGIFNIDGRIKFETKGDANVLPDEELVDEEYLIGKVVGSSTLAGKIVRLTANPLIFGVFVIIPILIIMITNIITTVKTAKQLQKEELEKALQEIGDRRKAEDDAALRAEIDRIKAELRQQEATEAGEAEEAGKSAGNQA